MDVRQTQELNVLVQFHLHSTWPTNGRQQTCRKCKIVYFSIMVNSSIKINKTLFNILQTVDT